MNEPQLSAEMEKRFDDEFGYLSVAIDYYVENAYPFRKESGMKHLEELKHFLATALEEQRMKVEVETGLKNFHVTMEEIAKARTDERAKVIVEVEELTKKMKKPKEDHFINYDDIPTCYACDYDQALDELRVKLNQLKEEKMKCYFCGAKLARAIFIADDECPSCGLTANMAWTDVINRLQNRIDELEKINERHTHDNDVIKTNIIYILLLEQGRQLLTFAKIDKTPDMTTDFHNYMYNLVASENVPISYDAGVFKGCVVVLEFDAYICTKERLQENVLNRLSELSKKTGIAYYKDAKVL